MHVMRFMFAPKQHRSAAKLGAERCMKFWIRPPDCATEAARSAATRMRCAAADRDAGDMSRRFGS